MRCRSVIVLIVLLSFPLTGMTQTLEPVPDIKWEPFREQIQLLLTQNQLFSPSARENLQKLLKVEKGDGVSIQAQKLVAPWCLLGIHINPESRVKAKRGEASVRLQLNQTTTLLVRAHNEAGLRSPMSVTGEALLRPGQRPTKGRWLEAEIVPLSPKSRGLSGEPLEYLLIRLTPRESGKREATLQLDAGQGTQDLGFRAEVPILFHISKRE